jgi:hypothetical protein
MQEETNHENDPVSVDDVVAVPVSSSSSPTVVPKVTTTLVPRVLAKLSRPADIVFERDVVVSDLAPSGQIMFAPILRSDGDTLILILRGGGVINTTFGVAEGYPEKVTVLPGETPKPPVYAHSVTCTVSLEDFQNLQKLEGSIADYIVKNREFFFQGSTGSDALLREKCGNIAKPGKKKKKGNGNWPPQISTIVKDKDKDLIVDEFGARKCKVKIGGEYVTDLFLLKGCKVTRLVFELRGFKVDSKGVMFSKRLRSITAQPGANYADIASSDEEEDGGYEVDRPTKKAKIS